MTNVTIDTFHSKYIAKLDVKDKASILIVLNKLQSGLLLMSSTYCRFFQGIMPMISMIDDYKDKNEDLCEFSRKKFASILRTYLRTDELAAEEQPMLYALKREMYDINLDPAAKQIESHVVVTLRDIDNSLFILMEDILTMAEDPNIDGWKENGRYEKISQSLHLLTKDILYAQEDFARAFLDTDSNAKLSNLIKNRRASQKILNDNLDSIATLISAVGSNVTLLCELYESVCNTVYTISTDIDLANPLHIEESEKSIEELYGDYHRMNDEAVKRDTYRNGLDLSLCKKEEKNRKSPFLRIFNIKHDTVVEEVVEEDETMD